jgi:hypothetical protein
VNARDIATRRHNASSPAANDDRPIVQLWVIAFLDGGIKRIAIEMGDAQLGKLGVF